MIKNYSEVLALSHVLAYVFFLHFSPLGLVVSGGFCVHDALRAGALSAIPLSARLRAPSSSVCTVTDLLLQPV